MKVRFLIALALAAAFAVPAFTADLPPNTLLAKGRVDDAIQALQNQISNGSKLADSYNLLCRAYFELNKWDPAIAACQKAVQLEPSNSAYHLWLGRVYGAKADHANFLAAAGLAGHVRDEFETAVRLDPRSIDARADLADFYLAAPGIVGGGKDKAAAQAREMSKLNAAQGLLIDAKVAEKNKDNAAAEADYRRAIEVSGGQSGPWLALANFYRRTGRLDEMEQAVVRATDPKLNRPDMLMEAAQVLITAGRNFPGAADLLRRYLQSEATVADAPVFRAHFLLGTLLEKQGDKAGAAQEYRAALALAKDFSQAQTALNRVQRGMQKSVNAER